MTFYGLVVALVFAASYVTMTVTSGMHGPKAKLIQWGCWGAAMLTMFACYLAGPATPG